MEIFYLGHSSFKLRGKDKTLITDPFDPAMVGIDFPRNEADIVTISHNHHDHDRSDLIGGNPKIVNGPGEYEIGGVSLVGISTFHDNKSGSLRGVNTVYIIEMDGVRLLHLGDLGHVLDKNVVSEMGVINVLFVPVGGEFTIGPKEANQVAEMVTASIVVPMHYQAEGLNQEMFSKLKRVDDFLALAGTKVERLPKLHVTADSFTTEEQKIAVLERR
jgi:L-ascorbate metabolism protein UlaG (beta-lactamase superfamily)